MRTRTLGFTGEHLSVIGFGAWAIGGGGWEYGWGPQDDADSIRAIHAALDIGVNWIDTAAVYGLGRSERVVAKALEGRRDRVFVATKCALVWDEAGKISGRIKAESVRRECEDSLRRLNTDVIDLYQIHWPNPDDEIEEGWGALQNLVRAGKIRYAGVSNFSVAQMKRAGAIAPVASLQPPYHLLRRDIEAEILPYCGANHIGVVAYSPLASGLLTGKFDRARIEALPDEDWRKRFSENYREPKLTPNLAFVDDLRAIAADHGRSVGQLAAAWVLRRPEVTSAIVGARNERQVGELFAGSDWELPAQTVERIENAWTVRFGS